MHRLMASVYATGPLESYDGQWKNGVFHRQGEKRRPSTARHSVDSPGVGCYPMGVWSGCLLVLSLLIEIKHLPCDGTVRTLSVTSDRTVRTLSVTGVYVNASNPPAAGKGREDTHSIPPAADPWRVDTKRLGGLPYR
jgi:hypothetical protein